MLWTVSLRKGFSLIELLLVIVLLSIVAGLSLPQFKKTYQRSVLNNAVSQLVYTMRYAQSRALLQNKNHRLEFESDLKSYKILEATDHPSEAFDKISGLAGKTTSLPGQITAHFSQTTLDFYTDGDIEKSDITLCSVKACQRISTSYQRGKVIVIRE
jgi:prepilin-type N-terminal cleavage/methylation domain-containing protein